MSSKTLIKIIPTLKGLMFFLKMLLDGDSANTFSKILINDAHCCLVRFVISSLKISSLNS